MSPSRWSNLSTKSQMIIDLSTRLTVAEKNIKMSLQPRGEENRAESAQSTFSAKSSQLHQLAFSKAWSQKTENSEYLSELLFFLLMSLCFTGSNHRRLQNRCCQQGVANHLSSSSGSLNPCQWKSLASLDTNQWVEVKLSSPIVIGFRQWTLMPQMYLLQQITVKRYLSPSLNKA